MDIYHFRNYVKAFFRTFYFGILAFIDSFRSSSSSFNCHCNLTSCEALCLLPLPLTFLTFLFSHCYSPSGASFGLKAISQRTATRPSKNLSDPTWAWRITGRGRPVAPAPGFLSDGWHRVQWDAAPAVDSPVSSVRPPSGRRHVRGRQNGWNPL